MSFFQNLGKNGQTKKAATPVVRTETRIVTKPAPARPVNAPSHVKRVSSAPPKPHVNEQSRLSAVRKSAPQPKTRDKDRLSVSRPSPHKRRKSISPSVQFGSSSEGESDGEIDVDRRRKKANITRIASPDLKRRIRDIDNWGETEGVNKTFALEHSIKITGGEHEKEYIPLFPDDPSYEVELQYPSASQREKFGLVIPRESDGYDPLTDLVQTITAVLQHYLPVEKSEQYLDSSTGIPWRLRRAFNKHDREALEETIRDFNSLIATSLHNGTIAKTIDAIPRLPLTLVERILTQVYTRTVSPRVEILKRYTVGSDNVYGELLAPFASQVFKDTNLSSSSILLDLGSGVGNVVLQAALEIGCESWGVEIMPNACELARLQVAEFPARVRMWGLSAGDVHLLQGDFLADPRVGEVLRKADVVLVNNQAFQPDTNGKLVDLLLDLKEGARVVSLKSFVPSGFKLMRRTSGSPCATLEVVRREFWRDWVSWTNAGGEYFVATKDSARIQRILGDNY